MELKCVCVIFSHTFKSLATSHFLLHFLSGVEYMMKVRRYFPQIHDPYLEQEFVENRIHSHKGMALVAMGIFNLFSFVFLLLDSLGGESILTLRLLFLGVTLPLFYLTYKTKSSQSYTTYCAIFILCAIGFHGHIQLQRDSSELLGIAIDIVILLGIFLLFRIHIIYETMLAFILLGMSVLITVYHREMPPIEFARALLSVCAAYCIGFVMASHWHQSERKLFLSKKEEEQLKKKYQASLESVKTLTGLIPLCSSCGKVKDDNGYWKRVEQYIADHTNAQMSHSICMSCIKELYGEDTHDEVAETTKKDKG